MNTHTANKLLLSAAARLGQPPLRFGCPKVRRYEK